MLVRPAVRQDPDNAGTPGASRRVFLLALILTTGCQDLRNLARGRTDQDHQLVINQPVGLSWIASLRSQ